MILWISDTIRSNNERNMKVPAGLRIQTEERQIMIQVVVKFANDDVQDLERDDSFYRRLQELRVHGIGGKQLITELIGDDWGPPPKGISISGTLEDGTPIEKEYISR